MPIRTTPLGLHRTQLRRLVERHDIRQRRDDVVNDDEAID